MSKVCVISGGFGDAMNQLAKAIYWREKENCDCNFEIIYVRDSVDERLLDNIKPLTRSYDQWVSSICEKNNFKTTIVQKNQKLAYEDYHKENTSLMLFGPNMNYDQKIWEPQRGLNIGFRPFENEMAIEKFPINFQYDDLTKNVIGQILPNTVCLQVRFGNEYPSKTPNACWKDVQQLVSIVKLLKSLNYNVALIGETQQNISALSKITDYYINCDALTAYNVLLSSSAAIVFSGFGANLSLLSGKKTLRMFWDPLEFHLQTHMQVRNLCTHLFANKDVLEQIKEWHEKN